MKVALLAPSLIPVPPLRYGGTERIVGVLANELHHRGHDVTLFASGDSRVDCRLVPVVPQALWRAGYLADPAPFFARTVELISREARDYDLIHSHLENYGFAFARRSPRPVVATLHGRIDEGATARLLPEYGDIPLIAISKDQRSHAPAANWLATIHHGLDFDGVPTGSGRGGYLLFVGRLAPEKGVADAIQVARRSGLPLIVAAKAIDGDELALYDEVVAPAVQSGWVTFAGEVDGPARDRLFADAVATLMMGNWPEPFGLVAIESLAAGTPVIARRTGALPEIIGHGRDGFLVDGVEGAAAAVASLDRIDRSAVRRRALKRFSAGRMVDEYVAVYERLIAGAGRSSRLGRAAAGRPRHPELAPLMAPAGAKKPRTRVGVT